MSIETIIEIIMSLSFMYTFLIQSVRRFIICTIY